MCYVDGIVLAQPASYRSIRPVVLRPGNQRQRVADEAGRIGTGALDSEERSVAKLLSP
jgi:hypothetical protein